MTAAKEEEVYKLNKKMEETFLRERTEPNLERYVMSELLSPIEDYEHAMQLVKENETIIQNLHLYYAAAELASNRKPDDTYFLNKLNGLFPEVPENDKAIIYYLNALYVRHASGRDSRGYREYLQKSVECSSNMKFVNNKYDLACISSGRQAEKLLSEAFKDIEKIETQESLQNKPNEYWLDIHRWIKEFILGTETTKDALELKKYEGINYAY